MTIFDSPNREVCTVYENRTNTPLQALDLMNDVTFLEASRKLAERMMIEGAPDAGQPHILRLPSVARPSAYAPGAGHPVKSFRRFRNTSIITTPPLPTNS